MKKITAICTAILIMVSVFGTVSVFADNTIPTLGYTDVVAESEFDRANGLTSNTYDMKKATGYTFNNIVPSPYENEKYGDVLEMYSGLTYDSNGTTKNYDNFLRFMYTKIDPNFVRGTATTAETKAKYNYTKLEMDICFEECLNGNLQTFFYQDTSLKTDYSLVTFKRTDAEEGKMQFLNGGSLTYYADTWYNIVVYVDLKANLYSAYINGVKGVENAKIFTSGNADELIGYGVAINAQTTSSKVYIDNMKYSVVEIPENGGLFMTEMGNGNKRLSYLTKTETALNKNTTGEAIFSGKNIIENATSVDTTIWGKKNNDVYSFVNTQEKGKVLNIKNNYVSGETTTYIDSFIRPQYSYVTAVNTLITDETERAKHQNVVVNFDVKVSAKNKFVIAMRAHNSSAENKYAELINFDAAGKIKVGTSEVENVTYEPNVWYSFVLSMNFVDHNFDAYMVDENGVVTTLAQNASIDPSYLYGITYQVSFQSGNTTDCTMSVDDLSYYSGSASLSTVARYGNKKLIGAGYANSGALESVETATIGASEYDIASVGFARGTDKYCMIWDSFETMVPAIAKTPLN